MRWFSRRPNASLCHRIDTLRPIFIVICQWCRTQQNIELCGQRCHFIDSKLSHNLVGAARPCTESALSSYIYSCEFVIPLLLSSPSLSVEIAPVLSSSASLLMKKAEASSPGTKENTDVLDKPRECLKSEVMLWSSSWPSPIILDALWTFSRGGMPSLRVFSQSSRFSKLGLPHRVHRPRIAVVN